MKFTYNKKLVNLNFLWKSKYRICLNATPLLNRTSPNLKPNTTQVKKYFWNNKTPAWIQPHLSSQFQIPILSLFRQDIPTSILWSPQNICDTLRIYQIKINEFYEQREIKKFALIPKRL